MLYIERASNEMNEYKEKRVDQILEIGETRLCCSVKIMLLIKCLNEESVWGDKWRDVTELQK